jgi:hypothetical protein
LFDEHTGGIDEAQSRAVARFVDYKPPTVSMSAQVMELHEG